MNVWIDVARSVPGFNSQKRLKLIGKTRWSSKQNAVDAIIGTETSFFVLIKALIKICSLKNLERQKLVNACENFNSWINYKNIVTTYVLNKIYTLLNRTCIFLQTSSLSLVEGVQSLKNCIAKLDNMKDEIESYFEEGDKFVKNVIELLDDDIDIRSHHIDIIRLPIEEVKREMISELQKEFKNFIKSLQNRILNHILLHFDHQDSLYREIQALDPLYASENMSSDTPIRLSKLCEINDVDEDTVIEEMKKIVVDFLQRPKQPNCVSFLNSDSGNNNYDEDSDDEEITVVIEDDSDFDETTANVQSQYVKFETLSKICHCSVCIFKYIGADEKRKEKFANILKVYKYVALIPPTQVKCERDFSKMKLIKTRLRASLTDQSLQNLILISTEANMFDYVNFDDLVDYIIAKSSKVSLYMNT